jgi:predicted Ser/Thr protein kinase
MNPERWERIKKLFHEVVDLEAEAREGFLEEHCPVGHELRPELDSLLTGVDQASIAIDGIPAEGDDGSPGTPVPERVGSYRIEGRLGTGGMGVVYLAEQDDPRRMVALKVVRAQALTDETHQRFRQEARLLGLLQHNGIAQIYEAGTTDVDGVETAFFAMEYVQGVPLTNHAAAAQLSTPQRLELLASICDAVHHAHQKGVIHRDLKPANILVDEQGVAKILDFGIARAADPDLKTVTIETRAGQIVGTLPYMAPEQALGRPEEIDTSCDVYALGVVAYELLGRRLPIDVSGCSVVDAARKIREVDPAPLGAIDASMRGDVETIVAKALEKDRERRYASAAELAADFRRYLGNEPIAARPASTFYQLTKFARRHRGLTLGALIAVVALIGGGAIASWQAVAARSAQRIAEQRFDDLHGFAKSIIFDYQRKQGLEGETKAREYLIATTLKYLDAMAEDTRGLDPEIVQDLAIAYAATGDVLGRPFGPNVGDPVASLANYEKSLEIFETLVQRVPDNVDYNHLRADG